MKAFELSRDTTPRNNVVAINYNASSASYIVEIGDKDLEFANTDIDPASPLGEQRFVAASSDVTNQFGFITGARSGNVNFSNVALGYVRSDYDQTDRLVYDSDYFVVGFPTPTGDIPLTGRLTYSTVLNGWFIEHGKRPDELYGEGLMVLDLSKGVFWMKSGATRTDIASSTTSNAQFEATGYLGSSIAGAFVFRPQYLQVFHVSGDLEGSFYGPRGREMAATFSGLNSSGDAVVGAFASREGANTTFNIAIDDLQFPEAYHAMDVHADITKDDLGNLFVESPGIGTGPFIDFRDGTFSVNRVGTFSDSNLVPHADDSFLVYQDDSSGVDTELRLYKSGAANPELQLTYVGFGQYFSGATNPQSSEEGAFLYGFTTPQGVVAPKTGSARYDGVSYGLAINQANDTIYDVKGSSSFLVNFSDQTYSGMLSLGGSPRGGGSVATFGDYTVSGGFAPTLSSLSWTQATLYKGADQVGILGWNFFGPNAEELGGVYYLSESLGGGDALYMRGATVANRD